MLRRLTCFALVAAAAAASSGCGSSTPEIIAFENRTFYQYDTSMNGDMSAFEQDYPPLDLPLNQPKSTQHQYWGKTIVAGAVHISRPPNWQIRAASNVPERRFIEYVSPNEYVIGIYELVESPRDVWRDIMARYEDQAKNDGAEILGKRIPVSTWNAQGRAYVVKRQVKAAKGPFQTMSREILARSDNRVVLVQIVHQGDTLEPLSDELLRVVETLEVL